MVRTKQAATSRFGGRNKTPSVASSSYFYGAKFDGELPPNGESQLFFSGISSQSQSLVRQLRENRDHGLVEYSSQFSHRDNTKTDVNGKLFASQNSTTSGILTQSQVSEKALIVKRPQVVAIKLPKMDSGIRKRKYRPGTRALMEIKKLQKTCHLLIRRAPFLRVVKDIVRNCSKGIDYKVQSEAVNALQEASEAFLVTLFEAANMCAIHGKRVTVMPQDLLLVKNLLSLFNVQI